MKYIILPKCVNNIKQFYLNVARKYAHTYSRELMHKNVDEAVDAMYMIEDGLLRRAPLLPEWAGCYMANTNKWYFAYKVFGDVVVVVDACHSQNMNY
ncbi:MAG: hypothetical protein KBT34_13930 [Prevotella sp.]|nr:hypothetical protein [Candidatus Prevotella equi]